MDESKNESHSSMTDNKQKFSEKFEKFHDKNYKHLLAIPLILLVFSIGYMFYFHSIHDDFIKKDISLTGGTTVTINDAEVDSTAIKNDLSSQLESLDTRQIYDIISKQQKAVIIETSTDSTTAKKVLEEYLGYELNDQNSSIEFTGSTLSGGFYNQLIIAVLIAFILMSLVVFVIFRSFVPSAAVIFSCFADIIMALVTVNLLGMEVSSAGIVAFLMLIGYSVDTDILLTNRVLKGGEESLNKKIFGSFKTGITMTVVALISVLSALLVIRSFSEVLSQIFTIIFIGLIFDLLNTWATNVSIIKWYVISKENKK
ncbi:hypothetical protein COU57_04390 [Candidatus Pacearchaeota archaeon CG10_big_fil_rev_8_21_14_0_10_32_14]|nr:MAG: hypothetical protein COU57_04390 [Candidatus Pacearchaeota archaeon CG10_big_fil_rev_8_21_14_0_10_32_14]